ncbi:hypothetical protein SteCoe_23693 [Stentor coeruleus]|uniref:Peptidase A1 domain-containing protein n=1 Tax=Stentor coeruleus TaxID=5963 RepID=A0A1R2BJA1_9CILI|nr:hypothetical protein SteCoe_23693 [Stentor coeruleus]
MLSLISILAIVLVQICSSLTLNLNQGPLKINSLSNNTNDRAYFTSISMGTPPQQFQVLISAWSPLIMLPDINSSCSTGQYFNSTGSKTFTSLSQSSSISYVDGSTSGILSKDTLTLGSTISISTNHQNFVLASSCDGSHYLEKGVLGLGFGGGLTSTSLVATMYLAGQIPLPSFSLYLSEVGLSGEKTPKKSSVLMIGEYDLSLFAESPKDGFTYHDLISNGDQWSVTLDEVNFESLTFLQEMSIKLDPGVEYIYGPNSYIAEIYSYIKLRHLCNLDPKKGGIACYCHETSNFASFYFYINGHEYSIPSDHYVERSDGICYIYIFGINEQYWILGSMLLRRYYSIWDYEGKRIGLTRSINDSSSSDNTSKTWVIILVVVLVVAIVGGSLVVVLVVAIVGGSILVLFIIYKKKKKYRQSILIGNETGEDRIN